jgi:hypothetical protein
MITQLADTPSTRRRLAKCWPTADIATNTKLDVRSFDLCVIAPLRLLELIARPYTVPAQPVLN